MNDYIIKLNEHIAKAKSWWQEKQPRERQAMSIGGAVLSVFLIYQLIWSPLSSLASDARSRIQKAEKTLAWMQAADSELKKRGGDTVNKTKPTSAVNLLSLTQKKIEQAGLSSSLSSLKQVSENSIEVQFVNVEFDALANLLSEFLKANAIAITQMSVIAQATPGVVNAAVVLSVN